MPNQFEEQVREMLGERPGPLPEEMAAAYDPATWAFTEALFKTLVAKGVFTVSDLKQMYEDILSSATKFRDSGETQREAAVNEIAEWLASYSEGLGSKD